MKRLTFLFSLSYLLFSFQAGFSQSLRVSDNGHYLVHEDGTPFFYLGDTAWELFHRLNKDEADTYLRNRAEKGFTVIQAVILAQLGGLTVPNATGDLPLIDSDPNKPNEAYFQHVDAIVDQATSLGLVVGMLPTWGSYWSSLNPDAVIFTPENAETFGQYVGKRYKDKSIIWILGGDHNIHTEAEREIIEAMAKGLRAGDQGEHLITYHPRGPGMSSDYFQEEEWLDFQMFQSSHGGHDHDNGLYAARDYALTPAKPTLDGEPRYEQMPVGFYFQGVNRHDHFDDYDVRQAAYWSILAGACGHTYGHNSIWQMYSSDRQSIIGAMVPWSEAINHPGAFQMTHLKTLFEARSLSKLIPGEAFIKNGPMTGGGRIRSAIADDKSFAIIYTPRGESFTVDKSIFSAQRIKELWYDPRYGISYPIHDGDTRAFQTYTPPTSGRGQDWILIIEDASLDLPLPRHH